MKPPKKLSQVVKNIKIKKAKKDYDKKKKKKSEAEKKAREEKRESNAKDYSVPHEGFMTIGTKMTKKNKPKNEGSTPSFYSKGGRLNKIKHRRK